MNGILRSDWGFDGFVVSDCRAVEDIHAHHHVTKTPAESASLAVNHGTDLERGTVYANLAEAVKKGLIIESELDRSLKRLMLARLRLGMFDDSERVPYAQISTPSPRRRTASSPGQPLYPFGYGLSYTRFHYDQLELPAELEAGKELVVKARVTNVGKRRSDEVAQVYVARERASPRAPLRALAAFDRIHLAPGESMSVELKLPPESFASINEKGAREYHPGSFDVSIGGGQPLARVAATSDFVRGRVELRAAQ